MDHRRQPPPTTTTTAQHPSRVHVLPPCRVCGEQARGFHYGVNTCEACKGFFQRSIRRQIPYKCTANRTSSISSKSNAITKRKMCPHCRWLRCLQTGMSINGIKIGRYTYEKRTQDILERRRFDELQRQRRLERRGHDGDPLNEDDLVVEDTSSKCSHFQPSRSMADATNEARRRVREQEIGYFKEDGLSERGGSFTDEEKLPKTRRHRRLSTESVCSEFGDTETPSKCESPHRCTTDTFVHQFQQRPELRSSELGFGCKRTAGREFQWPPYHLQTDLSCSSDPIMQLGTYLTECQVPAYCQHHHQSQHQQLYQQPIHRTRGQLVAVADEELLRHRRMAASQWMLGLKKGVSCVVEIAKRLPEFQTLPIADQINLIKRSVFEVWLMSKYRMFDKERRCYSSSDGTSYDLDTQLGVELSDVLLRVADRIQNLGLTDDQVAVTIALVIYVTGGLGLYDDIVHSALVVSDGVQLSRPGRVEEIQRRMQWSIIRLFERGSHRRGSCCDTRRHPGTTVVVPTDSGQRSPSHGNPSLGRRFAHLAFARLTGTLTELRSVHDAFDRFSQRIGNLVGAVPMPPMTSPQLPTTPLDELGLEVEGILAMPSSSSVIDLEIDIGTLQSFWRIFS